MTTYLYFDNLYIENPLSVNYFQVMKMNNFLYKKVMQMAESKLKNIMLRYYQKNEWEHWIAKSPL